MTVEQLKNAQHARPFRPFTLHVADGRSFRVEHPDFLSRSQSGRTVIVHGRDDRYDVLDMLLVSGIEVHATEVASDEAA